MAEERNQSGMNSAEYAVGTAAACGCASLLWLLTSYYDSLLRSLLSLGLEQVRYLWPRLW